MEITAAVARDVGAPFVIETVHLDAPRSDEVLVEISGVGLCHTDLAARDGHLPTPLPAVLGHEGSGTVVDIGKDITSVEVGDRVVISFASCGMCEQCRQGHPAYCAEMLARNFFGTRPDGSRSIEAGGDRIGSNFFGQSSFATHALTTERNVVKLPADLPVEIFGPLGCGVQTGAGAVLNSLDCQPGSSLLVLGGGSVGLSGVIAGVSRELAEIIVVEPHAKRRELALSLGATHAIDPANGPLAEQVRAIVPVGVHNALDTTGVIPVIEQGISALTHRGTFGSVAPPADPAARLPVNLLEAQVGGRRIMGIIQGDSNPQVFIPTLIDLYREGHFPFDALITRMPFTKINDAVAAQRNGEAIKIVLEHGTEEES